MPTVHTRSSRSSRSSSKAPNCAKLPTISGLLFTDALCLQMDSAFPLLVLAHGLPLAVPAPCFLATHADLRHLSSAFVLLTLLLILAHGLPLAVRPLVLLLRLQRSHVLRLGKPRNVVLHLQVGRSGSKALSNATHKSVPSTVPIACMLIPSRRQSLSTLPSPPTAFSSNKTNYSATHLLLVCCGIPHVQRRRLAIERVGGVGVEQQLRRGRQEGRHLVSPQSGFRTQQLLQERRTVWRGMAGNASS